MKTLEQRFWSKVRKTRGCWLWTAGKDRDGYGKIGIDGRMQLAHRVAWTLAHGPVPSGLCVLHRCDTPACVRIDHLFLGTQIENIADRTAKGRSASGDRNAARLYPERRPRGEQHAFAKLTEADVRAIRRLRKAGRKLWELADRFGVSQNTVSLIVAGRIWRHV